MVAFTLRVMPEFENHRAEAPAAPTNCTKLFRIIVLPIDQVYLVEYILRLFQADAMFSLDIASSGARPPTSSRRPTSSCDRR